MCESEICKTISSAIHGLFSTELVSAFIGAIVGGLFTSRATTKAHALESGRVQAEELSTTKNTLTLIRVELITAWTLYQQEYLTELTAVEAGKPLFMDFPIGENTFTIYDSAPSMLANAPPEISYLIVRTHMRIKGLIRMIEINNHEFNIARSDARIAVRAATDEAGRSYKQLEPEDQKNIYDHELYRSAIELGMEQNVEPLKSLTDELAQLMSQIVTNIDEFLASSNKTDTATSKTKQ